MIYSLLYKILPCSPPSPPTSPSDSLVAFSGSLSPRNPTLPPTHWWLFLSLHSHNSPPPPPTSPNDSLVTFLALHPPCSSPPPPMSQYETLWWGFPGSPSATGNASGDRDGSDDDNRFRNDVWAINKFFSLLFHILFTNYCF